MQVAFYNEIEAQISTERLSAYASPWDDFEVLARVLLARIYTT